jgi:hypothetical protein
VDRSDELMEAIREELRLSREELRLSREQRTRSDELFADTREFIREQTVRLQRYFERHERALADMSDQLRANTAATWAMVDLLRGGRA